MNTMTPTPEKAAPPPEKRTRRWVPTVAATVVALLAVSTMLFLRDGGTLGTAATTQPTVMQPDEATEVQIAAAIEAAQAYLEASAAGDVERARSLLAEGFRSGEVPNICRRGLATLEWCFRMHQGYEFEYRDIDCALHSLSPRLFIRCETIWSNAVERRTPAERPGPTAFLISFDRAGLILSVDYVPARQGPASEITDQDVLDWNDEFQAFREWTAFLERVDPDFAVLKELAPNQELGPEQAAEFFEKLAVYLDLYEDYAREAWEAWLRDRDEG